MEALLETAECACGRYYEPAPAAGQCYAGSSLQRAVRGLVDTASISGGDVLVKAPGPVEKPRRRGLRYWRE